MKHQLRFAAILCLVAAPAWAQSRHGDMSMGMHHRLSRTAKLAVHDEPAAQEMTVRVGPLDLPAGTSHMAAAQPPDFYLTIPFDGWLTAYHPRIVDARGQALPGKLIHHVAFWNTARSDWLCPSSQEHIFGAGGEMNDWPAVVGVGYGVAKGTRIRISTMVHNPTAVSYSDAYLEVRVEYQRSAPGGPRLKDVYPSWFDVTECGDSAYDLPPGKNVKTGKITLHYSGRLLGVGGHLHDYGRQLVLTDLTRKQEIAMLDSSLDADGRIVSMPVVSFVREGGYKLAKGEVIETQATYDNPTGELLGEGAMGIVVGYFLPDEDSQMATLRRVRTKSRAQAAAGGR